MMCLISNLMKNRKRRVDLIIDLITHQCISSQEQLSSLLQAEGFNVTQATLSRDLKLLKTTKVPTDNGGYMYILPDQNHVHDQLLAAGQTRSHGAHVLGFSSIEFSGNMCVIKSRNGYATGLAYDIDLLKCPEILGSVAGSNTIFMVIREGVSHRDALKALSRVLPIDDGMIDQLTPKH